MRKKGTRWDGLHDLVGLDLVVDLEGVQVARGPELELSDAILLVFLDSDLFGGGQVLLLFSHDLDEFLEVLNFLGLLSLARSQPYHIYIYDP